MMYNMFILFNYNIIILYNEYRNFTSWKNSIEIDTLNIAYCKAKILWFQQFQTIVRNTFIRNSNNFCQIVYFRAEIVTSIRVALPSDRIHIQIVGFIETAYPISSQVELATILTRPWVKIMSPSVWEKSRDPAVTRP